MRKVGFPSLGAVVRLEASDFSLQEYALHIGVQTVCVHLYTNCFLDVGPGPACPPSPPRESHPLPSSLRSSFLMQTGGSPFWCKPPTLLLLWSSAPSLATLRYPGAIPEGRAPGPGLCLL